MDEPPMGPHFDTHSHPGGSQSDNESNESDISEGAWITQNKKTKKPHRMTQTKLFDMMQNSDKNNKQQQDRSPQRPGRGTPPRKNQSGYGQKSYTTMTTLTSSHRGHIDPRGREE